MNAVAPISGWKTRSIIVAKVAVSALLLYWLLSLVGWSELWREARQMQWGMTVLAFAIIVTQFPLSALKWKLSLRQHDLSYGFNYLLVVASIGFFMNNFLPTGVGGDAYRVLKTLPASGKKSRAVSAVLFDRATGLLALLVMGFIAAMLLYVIEEIPFLEQVMPLAALCALFGLLLLALLLRRPPAILQRAQDKFAAKFSPITDNLKLIKRPTAVIRNFVQLSFFFQITAFAVLYCLFQAAGHPIGLLECAIIVAFGGVVVMLPISIAGIGVYEGALVSAAVLLGIPAEPAILVSIVYRLLTVPISVFCGIIFLIVTLRGLPASGKKADAPVA